MTLSPYDQRRLVRLRWTAFTVVGLAYVLAFFHRFAPAAIAGDLQSAFAIQSAALGSLAATYFYIYTLMQLPTGVLADTLGPRRIVAVGSVIAGVGSLLFGVADSFAWASAGRLLVGLGVSVAFIALLKINAAWFPESRFGAVTGLTLLMGNLGSVLAASPLAWALGYVTWREVFMAAGAVSLALAWMAWWLVRDNPVQAGLPSMRALEGRADHAPHHGHWFDGIRAVAGNRLTWPGFFLNLGVCGSLFAFAGLWAIPFLTQGHGLTRSEAAAHTTLLLAAFAVGAFAIGLISDRLGRRKPVVLAACLIYVLAWLPLALGWRLEPGWSHALFIVMGLGGSGFTLSWACAKEVNRHALSGTATALVNTGGFLGAAILQPLTGWVLDRAAEGASLHLAHYQAGLGLLVVCAAGGTVAGLWLKETHCRYLDEPPVPRA